MDEHKGGLDWPTVATKFYFVISLISKIIVVHRPNFCCYLK